MVTCPTPVPAPQRGQLRQVRGSLGLTHLASDPRGRLSPAELRDGGRGVPGAMAAGYLEGCAYIAGLTEGLSSAMGPKAGLRGQGLRRSLEGTQASGEP